MNLRTGTLIVASLAATAVGSLALLAPPAAGAHNEVATTSADTFQVDAVHSAVLFKIGHLGVSNFYGRFNEMSGSFRLDADNPSQSSVEIEVKAASVDSANKDRDEHLKSPDFFNVREYPTATFKSTSVAADGPHDFKVTGNLTLHGQTRSITIALKHLGEATVGRFGHRSGFETSFTINRMDFGIETYPELLSKDVTLTVAVEGINPSEG